MSVFASSSQRRQRRQRHMAPPMLLLLLLAFISACSFPSLAGAFTIRPTPQPSLVVGARRGTQGGGFTWSISRSSDAWQQQHLSPSSRRRSMRLQAADEGEQQQEGWLVRLGYKAGAEDKGRSLKERLKSAGLAGVFAYIASELLFWLISLPAGILFYHQTTGEWLDVSAAEGQAKVAAFSAGFLTFARVALPLRAAVALAITPPLSKFVVQPLIDRGVLQEREEKEEAAE